jgi:hypothetical protein
VYGWGEKPGLSGAAFFDLHTDPREGFTKPVAFSGAIAKYIFQFL